MRLTRGTILFKSLAGRLITLRVWTIPLVYIVATLVAGYFVPRFETRFIHYGHPMAVASAIAFFSAVSSGMIALTGIVFAVAFVLVQFVAGNYSPRLSIVLSSDPRLFHSLGIFIATFLYSLVALMWTDRTDLAVDVPVISVYIVIVLLVVSMVVFALTIQLVNDLQISTILQAVRRPTSCRY